MNGVSTKRSRDHPNGHIVGSIIYTTSFNVEYRTITGRSESSFCIRRMSYILMLRDYLSLYDLIHIQYVTDTTAPVRLQLHRDALVWPKDNLIRIISSCAGPKLLVPLM